MIEDLIQKASDWQALMLLIEWGIFIAIMVVGIIAWLILKALE